MDVLKVPFQIHSIIVKKSYLIKHYALYAPKSINIYKSMTHNIHLIQVLIKPKGFSIVYLHEQNYGEIKYDANSSINGVFFVVHGLLKFK